MESERRLLARAITAEEKATSLRGWVAVTQAQAAKFQDRADWLERKAEDRGGVLSALLTGASAEAPTRRKKTKLALRGSPPQPMAPPRIRAKLRHWCSGSQGMMDVGA